MEAAHHLPGSDRDQKTQFSLIPTNNSSSSRHFHSLPFRVTADTPLPQPIHTPIKPPNTTHHVSPHQTKPNQKHYQINPRKQCLSQNHDNSTRTREKQLRSATSASSAASSRTPTANAPAPSAAKSRTTIISTDPPTPQRLRYPPPAEPRAPRSSRSTGANTSSIRRVC